MSQGGKLQLEPNLNLNTCRSPRSLEPNFANTITILVCIPQTTGTCGRGRDPECHRRQRQRVARMGTTVPGKILHKTYLAFLDALRACRERKRPDMNPLSCSVVYTCPSPRRTTNVEDLEPVAVPV